LGNGVAALAGNCDDLIDQLFCGMYKKLVRAAYIRLRNYQTAEDIVQDVFVLAQEKRDSLLIHPNPGGWLFDALKKKILHEFRSMIRFNSMKLRLEMEIPAQQFTEIGFRSDRFDFLTEIEYEMLVTIYIDGFTIRMVADKLGYTYETCRRHVQRTKNKIRNA